MKKNYPDMRILDETDKYFLGHIFEDAYKLTDDQRRAINEARQQIKNGEFLTDEQANKEIDEWLTR
jgi:predicted transcriptional regulator